MPTVNLLVLASSRKRRGRCVAGWDLDNGCWVRPVSPRADGTLELAHCELDGSWPEVFDVVRVDLTAHQPTAYQPENWIIADEPWQLLERADPRAIVEDLRATTDHDTWLLRSSDRRVEGAALRAHAAASSLVLVEPSTLAWRIETAPWGERQRKADFQVGGGGWYDFAVTDIAIFERLRELDDGNYPRDAVGIADESDVFVTVSLAEPYEENDRCYKLAAAILEIPA
jgi:hypothetical protein